MLGLVAAHARDECLDLRLQVRVERERLLQVEIMVREIIFY